jgi:type IV secretory pathway VirJ component
VKILPYVIIFSSMCWFTVSAGETMVRQAQIELNDGTTIVGVIKGIRNGTYTVESASAGTMTIASSQVHRVSYTGVEVAQPATVESAESESAAATASTVAPALDVNVLTQQLLSSPDMMNMLSELAQDPKMMEIIMDESLMADIASGDLSKLMGSEKIQSLAENETIKAMTQQLVLGEAVGVETIQVESVKVETIQVELIQVEPATVKPDTATDLEDW